MNYDEIVKALKEERRLNEELGKIIENHPTMTLHIMKMKRAILNQYQPKNREMVVI